MPSLPIHNRLSFEGEERTRLPVLSPLQEGDLLVVKKSKSTIRIIQKYSSIIVRLGREIGTFHTRFFCFFHFVPTFF